jgi:hypothetical protein
MVSSCDDELMLPKIPVRVVYVEYTLDVWMLITIAYKSLSKNYSANIQNIPVRTNILGEIFPISYIL